MKVRMDANEFKNIINNTKKFTGCNSNLMTYIRLEIDAERKYIKATALDGHRLSVEYARIEYADESFGCYIKPCIPKITKKTGCIELEVTGRKLLMQADDQIMGYVQPEGEFYNTDKTIKSSLKSEPIATIGVNAKYLLDALQSVKDPGSSRDIIKIDVCKKSEPLIIRSGGKSNIPENIKLILPVKLGE